MKWHLLVYLTLVYLPSALRASEAGTSEFDLDRLKGITLTTPSGLEYRLEPPLRKRVAILLFFPGTWDPHSVHALKILRNQEAELTRKGFQVLAVAPERPRVLRELVDEMDLSFVVLSDPEQATARLLGALEPLTSQRSKQLLDAGIRLESRIGFVPDALPSVSFYFFAEDGRIGEVWKPDFPKEIINEDDLMRWAQRARETEAFRNSEPR